MACEVCGKTYVWNPDENIDAKPHVCMICGLSFSLKIQLKRHGETHVNGQPYVCITCSTNPAQAESKSYNLRLNKKTDNYACDVCGENFGSKRMLLRHSIKEHCLENSDESSETESDDYEAPKKKRRSNFSTKKPKGLGSKKKETPPENKRYFCTNCCRGFVYQSYYDKHISEGKCLEQKTVSNLPKVNKKSKKIDVFDSKKHECDVCGKSFARKSSLEGHMVLHVQEDSDYGPDEKDFYDSNADESDDYGSEPKKPKTPKVRVIRKSFACEKCNFVCFSKPTFEKHSKVHEKEDIITEVNDVSACILLSASNPDNETIEEPSVEKVKDTHLCGICNKVFVTKGRLKKHLMFHVSSQLEEGDKEVATTKLPFTPRARQKRSKDHRCELCGKEFASLTCFKKHTLKHTEPNPDPTDPEYSETRKRKPKPSSRKKKWITPMECEFCHEIFEGKRSAYIKHLHSHTPEVCGICDERFVDRPSLREHCKVHIGTEEGRIFVECSQKALEAKLGIMPPEPKVEYIYLTLR